MGPVAERILFNELLDGLIRDYRLNGRKSTDILEQRLKPIRETFGALRAVDVTEDRIETYKEARLAKGKANATVNRELAAIMRAFRLGVKQKRIITVPNVEMLAERNARQGLFEEPEFRAVTGALDEDVRPAIEFLYLTGWRTGEVLPLQWPQVDFQAGAVRLEPGTTKNDEGREFPFDALPELAALLRRQRARTDLIELTRGESIPWVVHRRGRPIKDFRSAWDKACTTAGVPGKIPHDMRRTAVRNLERAGMPRSVAMKLTGHKTETVYRRYAIVANIDLREGVAKLAALRGEPAQFPHKKRYGQPARSHKSLR